MRYEIVLPLRLGSTLALPGDVLVQTEDGWHLVRAIRPDAVTAALSASPDAVQADGPPHSPALRLLA